MDNIENKEQSTTHKIGIYLWIWGLLFVLSFFSYMVDWFAFQGLLRWSLILTFMFLKAGFFYAFILGEVCSSKCSFVANDSNSLFYYSYGC